MVYNVNNPQIIIFNTTEHMANIVSAANNEKSQQQIINYGIEMLKNSGEFETNLMTWFDLPPADLAWTNFKLIYLINNRMRASICLFCKINARIQQCPILT